MNLSDCSRKVRQGNKYRIGVSRQKSKRNLDNGQASCFLKSDSVGGPLKTVVVDLGVNFILLNLVRLVVNDHQTLGSFVNEINVTFDDLITQRASHV